MHYQPLADRILATDFGDPRTTKGGLIIPDAVREHRHLAFALVQAVGPGRVNAQGQVVPLSVKEGDIIAYPRKAAAPIPLLDEHGNDTTTLLIRECDVIAIVHDMPRDTGLTDMSGLALLAMRPTSLAKPDSGYRAEAELAVAQKAGWDTGDGYSEDDA